jgi:hypothetical protein
MTHPHYIDREAVAKIIDPAAFMFSPGELDDKVYSASRAYAFDRADRVIALIFAPMEAVAWRLKRVDVERWNLWDLDPRVDTPAYADASKWTVQALAVISTPEDGRTK